MVEEQTISSDLGEVAPEEEGKNMFVFLASASRIDIDIVIIVSLIIAATS